MNVVEAMPRQNHFNMRLANLANYHDTLPATSAKATSIQQAMQHEM